MQPGSADHQLSNRLALMESSSDRLKVFRSYVVLPALASNALLSWWKLYGTDVHNHSASRLWDLTMQVLRYCFPQQHSTDTKTIVVLDDIFNVDTIDDKPIAE